MNRTLKARSAAAVAMFLTAAALTACTPSRASAPTPARTSGAATASAAAPEGCDDTVAAGCRELSVDGRTYRYYLTEPPAGATGDALLVDIGGPGMSLAGVLPMNYQDEFRKNLGRVAEGRSLLLIEEPWTSGTQDAACAASAAGFYAAARRTWREPSAALPDIRCPWGQGGYGWNRDSYRKVVSAITAKEKLTSLDMAAISFGAVRYSYVDDLVGTATLVRPAAAPGTANDRILRARTAQLWKALVARCSGCTAATVRDAVGTLLRQHRDTAAEQADRSVPVTGFDVASALVAAGISTSDKPDLGWRRGTAKVDEKVAAQLSDALWMRIGVEEVSPALIAYADEYCQAYPGAVRRTGNDPIRDILGAPSACTGRTAQPHHQPRPVQCLIIGTNDTSAPAALAQTWRVAKGGSTVTSAARKHWFTDVDKCAKGK